MKPKLTRLEREAINTAGRLGLWVLFEGPYHDRKWTIYARPVGKAVGTYHPRTGNYSFHHNRGRTQDWRQALEIASAIGVTAVK